MEARELCDLVKKNQGHFESSSAGELLILARNIFGDGSRVPLITGNECLDSSDWRVYYCRPNKPLDQFIFQHFLEGLEAVSKVNINSLPINLRDTKGGIEIEIGQRGYVDDGHNIGNIGIHQSGTGNCYDLYLSYVSHSGSPAAYSSRVVRSVSWFEKTLEPYCQINLARE